LKRKYGVMLAVTASALKTMNPPRRRNRGHTSSKPAVRAIAATEAPTPAIVKYRPVGSSGYSEK